MKRSTFALVAPVTALVVLSSTGAAWGFYDCEATTVDVVVL
jgi:hypothetical protein